jgi:hypothetical protein
MIPLTSKRYLTIAELAGTQTYYVYYGSNTISLPTVPSGITLTNNNPSAGYFRVQITSTTLGVFSNSYVYATVDGVDYKLYFDVVGVDTRFKIVPSCCTDNRNIMWFNRYGGFQNWNFTRKRTDSINMEGTESTYENDLDITTADIGKVYPTESIDVLIGKAHIDVVSKLKYSIRHYLYNDVTGAFDTQIKVVRESFDKYNNGGNRYFDFGFKYYKQRLNVQCG